MGLYDKGFEGIFIDETYYDELDDQRHVHTGPKNLADLVIDRTGHMEIRGEITLLCAVIMQAVEDRDYEWILGDTCQAICKAMSLDHDAIREYLEETENSVGG